MKLPHPKIDMASSLQEFDVWVTPSLGEIRDTEKYQQALAHLVNGFEVLMQATQGFADDEACHPDRFVPALQQIIGELSPAESAELLKTITSVLYLVTGKTDNNVKCQFPLFLRDQARLTTLPIARKRGLSTIALPRVLKAERLMRIVAGLKDYPQQQALLLQRFVEFILSDETYISQFWSIGHSFVALNSIGKGGRPVESVGRLPGTGISVSTRRSRSRRHFASAIDGMGAASRHRFQRGRCHSRPVGLCISGTRSLHSQNTRLRLCAALPIVAEGQEVIDSVPILRRRFG